MKYNISIISPKTWIHHSAVNEVVLYFYFMIKKKMDVKISFNKIDLERINIFFFAWNLPKDANIPENSIIFQSEDLDKSISYLKVIRLFFLDLLIYQYDKNIETFLFFINWITI